VPSCYNNLYNNWIVNLASGVAYMDSRTGEGRAQAASAAGRRVQTGCGRGWRARAAAGNPKSRCYARGVAYGGGQTGWQVKPSCRSLRRDSAVWRLVTLIMAWPLSMVRWSRQSNCESEFGSFEKRSVGCYHLHLSLAFTLLFKNVTLFIFFIK